MLPPANAGEPVVELSFQMQAALFCARECDVRAMGAIMQETKQNVKAT